MRHVTLHTPAPVKRKERQGSEIFVERGDKHTLQGRIRGAGQTLGCVLLESFMVTVKKANVRKVRANCIRVEGGEVSFHLFICQATDVARGTLRTST